MSGVGQTEPAGQVEQRVDPCGKYTAPMPQLLQPVNVCKPAAPENLPAGHAMVVDVVGHAYPGKQVEHEPPGTEYSPLTVQSRQYAKAVVPTFAVYLPAGQAMAEDCVGQ